MGPRAASLALAGALALAACGPPSVDRPDVGSIFTPDAGGAPPPRPTVEAAERRVPYPLATLRGAAAGRRVIVEPSGGANPVAKAVLRGEFCVDVPLPEPGEYGFVIHTQDEDGQLSEPSAPVYVTFDPAAPPVLGARTCSGADPAGCANAVEICGNGRDDDCNGLVDDEDPACRACQDDVLEPNDDPGAPRIEPGRYEDLKICPLNQDYYGVFARRGEIIDARIAFTHARGNLDLHLLGLDHRTILARSVGLTDREVITHTATAAGEYKLRVFGEGGASGEYTLELQVLPGR